MRIPNRMSCFLSWIPIKGLIDHEAYQRVESFLSSLSPHHPSEIISINTRSLHHHTVPCISVDTFLHSDAEACRSELKFFWGFRACIAEWCIHDNLVDRVQAGPHSTCKKRSIRTLCPMLSKPAERRFDSAGPSRFWWAQLPFEQQRPGKTWSNLVCSSLLHWFSRTIWHNASQWQYPTLNRRLHPAIPMQQAHPQSAQLASSSLLFRIMSTLYDDRNPIRFPTHYLQHHIIQIWEGFLVYPLFVVSWLVSFVHMTLKNRIRGNIRGCFESLWINAIFQFFLSSTLSTLRLSPTPLFLLSCLFSSSVVSNRKVSNKLNFPFLRNKRLRQSSRDSRWVFQFMEDFCFIYIGNGFPYAHFDPRTPLFDTCTPPRQLSFWGNPH